MATPRFTTPPVILFIGSDESLADECALANPVVPVLRVDHPAAAVERMLVTRPIVVVIDESVSADDVTSITEHAQDIRAGVVHASAVQPGELTAAVRDAIIAATRE
jgi:hypothetical protein